MEPTVKSPLTGSDNTEQIDSVRCAEIVEIYRRYFGIDIAGHLPATGDIKLYRCDDTGYLFYYPFDVAGDESYYAVMSRFEWYYHPNRWEHQKALELIEPHDRTLEVGSGKGFFIRQLLNKGVSAYGLELNGNAIAFARESGFELIKATIEAYSAEHPAEFDVVCSFQVLEHVPEPLSFLNAALKCLKPGGKIIIGVPNNDSYIKHNRMDNRVLNMPPHHVGLWNRASLSALQGILKITLREIQYEPLVDGNVAVYAWNKLDRLLLGRSRLTHAVWRLGGEKLLVPLFGSLAGKIKGSSMLAVFTADA